jgi:hypothetical protein
MPDLGLDDILKSAFGLIARGVDDRGSGFRTPALATVDEAGAPQQRIVVLRAFDPLARAVSVHTDKRSAKAGEIAREPRIGLLFYDAGARVQARLTGRASLHSSGDVADTAWRGSHKGSRLSYAAVDAPGAVVPAPPDPPNDVEAGRMNFMVILLEFDRLDWLWLAPSGHIRALFTWRGEDMDAAWLAP